MLLLLYPPLYIYTASWNNIFEVRTAVATAAFHFSNLVAFFRRCRCAFDYAGVLAQVEDKGRQELRKFRAQAGIDAQEHLIALEKQVYTMTPV